MTTALISELIIHPALAALPMPPADDPEVKAVVNSICDVGRLFYPVLVNKSRVVDGRIRLAGAKAAGLVSVPVVEVEESEIASVVVHSLIARRHYTKSGLAYLAIPLCEAALAESRQRRLANLKSTASLRDGQHAASASTNTAEELAASLGISRRFFFMARDIHKKFASSPKNIRAEWEPKILSGKMSLEQAQQSLAGKLAALSGKTTPKGDPNQLMLELFESAEVRLTRWEKLTAAQRTKAKDKFREQFLCKLPDELIEETEQYLRERKASRSGALRA